MSLSKYRPPATTAARRRAAAPVVGDQRRYDLDVYAASRAAGLTAVNAAARAFIGPTHVQPTTKRKPEFSKQAEVDDRIKGKLQRAQEVILDALTDESKIAEAKVSELASALGTVTDRLRLYQNKSTSNVIHHGNPNARADRIRAILLGTFTPDDGGGLVSDAGQGDSDQPLS